MRTIRMTLDEDLVQEVDRVSARLSTSRSAFTRKTLREAIARYRLERLEHSHRRGYEQHPVAADESPVREMEQDWGDG
ncbi:MAG TPA: CopG family transcriptional regulator [Acidobacteriota bacterium]|nr:CopG family transcriptional regulator [Acidobacteriota bacterium]